MSSLVTGLIVFGMLVSITTPVNADPTMECDIQSGSQVETGECLAEVEKNANAALEIIFGFAMNAARELDKVTGRDATVPALKVGQDGSLQYRDKHCEYVGATYGGGSGTGIAILSCRIELARARSNELMVLTI